MQAQYIEPGSHQENMFCENFNGKLRDELLDGEMFMTLRKNGVVIENWRQHYNHRRPRAPLTIFTPSQR